MKSKIIIFVCFSVAISLPVSAQKTVKIWGNNPASSKMNRAEVVVFQAKENPSGVSVIICPGGSYCYLGKKVEGTKVAKWLNKNNITAFVLYYRVGIFGNHHPAMIQDLQRTIQLVKENCVAYGIDPDKVGIMGFSAGGHLAGTAAIYSHYKPYFAAMIYPVVSMQDSICHKKSRKNLLGKNYDDKLKQMMSLESNVHAGMPPIFLMHCTGDKTVDYRNSVVFAKALTGSNIKHKFLLIDEYGRGGHGFGIKPNGKATGWIKEFLEWMVGIEY